MFHMDIVKVDPDVAYVAMVVHRSFKLLFLMFYLFFIRMLQVCLFGCCICFTHILQVFYLDVGCVFCNGLFKCFMCFLQMFQIYVSSVLSVFRRMLQMFHLDVCRRNMVSSPPRGVPVVVDYR